MDPRADCTNFLPSAIYAHVKTFTDTIEIVVDGSNDPVFYPVYYFNPGNFLNGVLHVEIPENSYPIVVINRNLTLPNGYLFSIAAYGNNRSDRLLIMDATKISTIEPPLAILKDGSVEQQEGELVPERKMVTFMVTRPEGVETGEYTLIALDVPIPKVIAPVAEYPTQLFPIVEPPFDGIDGRFMTWDYDSVCGKTLTFKDQGVYDDGNLRLPKYRVGDAVVPTLGAEYRLLNLLNGNASLIFEPPFVLEPWFVYQYGYVVKTHQNINNLRERYPEAQFTLTGPTVTFNRGPSIEGLPPEYAAISFPLPQTWDGQHMSNGTRVKVRLDSIAEWNGMTTVYAGISSNQVEGYPWDNIYGYETITVGEEKVYITDVGHSNLVLGSPGWDADISDITFSVWLETEPGVWLSVTDYYSYVKPIEHKLVTPQNNPYLYQGGYARVVVTDISYGGDTGSDITEIRWAVIGDLNN